ncbi:RS10B protein, partial [Ptilonorhynchus violaceus]|nr:RS10B protein [Ptilonorhynchus violaceus]
GDSKDDLSLLNEDVKKEQDSCSAEELTDEAKEDNTEQEEEFSLWMWQVQTFFTTKLFPAYQHEKVLREKIKENQKQDAELAEVRKIQDEELARLIAEKEVEAAKRREAAAAEKALASQSAEKGLSPKRGFLPKKETPKKEPSAK